MQKVYITGVGSVSAQKTYDNSVFLEEITDHNSNVIYAQDPNYKAYFTPAVARRMSKGIKMGVAATKIALQEAGIETVDAIITGTGMGCVRDSEKFVSAIIDNNEQFLTPTSFIQSTHNTVAGQIAINLGCKGYNFTYVHSSVSFESAVLDALLQLENKEADTILVGGVDELGDHTVKVHGIIEHVKKEPVLASKLLQSGTKGAVFGEGANFFVLSNKKTETSYAQVVDVKLMNTLSETDVETAALSFLEANNSKAEDIDLVIVGNNGDVTYDGYYNKFTSGVFATTDQAYYKHLSGEFNTANSFAFWLASNILKGQEIPDVVKLNSYKSRAYKKVLIYNQYHGENHSFTLLSSC